MIRFMKAFAAVTTIVSALAVSTPLSLAAEKALTIGYQKIYNPWKVAIADRSLEKLTGYRINWRAFTSGAKVTEAMAKGEVQIAMAGSSPIAAAVSQGLEAELFWIAEDIAAAEALVVRNGSGIVSPRDLRSKKLAVPFVSTAHFHTLFALEQFGINPVEVELLNMPPDAISSAWINGSIDAAFIWNPALAEIKKSGKVLITSGTLNQWGKATFDGMIALKAWSKEHPDFMIQFVKTLAAADEDYRKNGEDWTAETAAVRKIAKVVGGEPEAVLSGLALYAFPTMEEQASDRWLGGGKSGGAAQALFHTSSFLKDEKRIDALLDDYSGAVNSSWVTRAMSE